ncbi:MAG TPA: helix-turn-helix domain-containing protein [Gaiellaceae bacterium]|nr:helix-turn-helix domain-containing protein [Gaiellaceae bacterium]
MFAIGSSLKEARLRKGLDLASAAEATKIRSRHLQALEDEQFDVLPGQTYVRGFLKTYADFLGLDGQLYVDEYSSRFWVNDDGTPATRRKVRVRRKHHGRIELNMIVLTLVVIVGVTSLVIAAWKFGGANTSQKKKASTPALTPVKAAQRGSTATLVVKATTGTSLVDVHVLLGGGRVGRLLFHGTLDRGETQTFTGRNLWLTVSSPRHVALALNGSSLLQLGGVCPRTIAVTPQQITQTPSCR